MQRTGKRSPHSQSCWTRTHPPSCRGKKGPPQEVASDPASLLKSPSRTAATFLARTPGGMATAQELFGAEAGAAPGLECWRIEAMKPVPNADALKGRFCEGGC